MGFDALHLSADEQPLLDALRASIRWPSYRPKPRGPTSPDQIYDNLDGDPQVPDEPAPGGPASRRELIAALRPAADAGADACFSRAREFCWTHQQEGENADEAPLGHVHDLAALADWLHGPASGLSRRETLNWLRDLVRLPGTAERRLEEQRAALATATLARYQMWSVHPEKGTESFADLATKRIELINRLGLGHLDDPRFELVYWMHDLGGIAAHRPTSWDADLTSPWWRPTGRTEPLDGSGSARGLPEVVHSPIQSGHLATPISEVSS
jgi:hypothetical protein